jgi:hypothetical protein
MLLKKFFWQRAEAKNTSFIIKNATRVGHRQKNMREIFRAYFYYITGKIARAMRK